MVASDKAVDIKPEYYVIEAARRNLQCFARYVNNTLVLKPFHVVYYKLLDIFAHGGIKKMIIQMPPQCGKSEGSSRILPAFMLGINPNLRICIASYSALIARDFNRDVQRIIENNNYNKVFPKTKLFNNTKKKINYFRNMNVFEVVNFKGSLRIVGIGGSLTSKTIDVMILDDIYKDYAKSNSYLVREAIWKWYVTVVKSRLHNKSQELIVFTRWHEDDLIGRIADNGEKIIDIKKWDDLKNVNDDSWVRLNFQAIKEDEAFELDQRQKGEVLWPEFHSLKKLNIIKKIDPVQFECLYQGNPQPPEGKLYIFPFKTWIDKRDWGDFVRSGNYTDVADEGDDYLFSVCYDIYKSKNTIFNETKKRFEPLLFALVTDMLYTKENLNVCTILVANMVNRNGVQKMWIESNGAGSVFEKIIQKKIKAMTAPFHQNQNKESRIIVNASIVNAQVIMPFGWDNRFKDIYEHISKFLRDFKANVHDDIEDGLTGICEKELLDNNILTYTKMHPGVLRLN